MSERTQENVGERNVSTQIDISGDNSGLKHWKGEKRT